MYNYIHRERGRIVLIEILELQVSSIYIIWGGAAQSQPGAPRSAPDIYFSGKQLKKKQTKQSKQNKNKNKKVYLFIYLFIYLTDPRMGASGFEPRPPQ